MTMKALIQAEKKLEDFVEPVDMNTIKQQTPY